MEKSYTPRAAAWENKTSPDQERIVELQGVNLFYRERPILQDIELTVYSRDFLAILGPNGGGKSTLIKLILGLLSPNTGKIRLFGHKSKYKVHKVGYLPQHISVKEDFPVTVLEIVLMGMLQSKKLGCFYRDRDKQQAMHSLEKVEMQDYAGYNINHLSGGQKQRVFIARALVSDPWLLVMDEPTSNIDPQGKFCFYEFLSSLSDSVTILVVSHDLSITSAGINSLGCLNQRLVYNPEPKLTPEMFDLLYGVHRHACPLTVHGPYPESVFST